MSFDPRTMSKPVYKALKDLRGNRRQDDPLVKEQKSQAVELYTYLATWGMLRLKAEEQALKQEGKKQVVQKFFECLQELSGRENDLVGQQGLATLMNQELSVDEYLGLTGLGLAIAQEFSFWAAAVYSDVTGGN